MSVSSKCYYALRAMYALSENLSTEPMKIAEIADSQRIPIRFLEVILNQLKGGGFVQSRRGAEGGYRLARPSDQVTVGEIMRFIDGPIAPVNCVSQSRPKVCEFPGGCEFMPFWGRLRQVDLRCGQPDNIRRPGARNWRAQADSIRRLGHLKRTDTVIRDLDAYCRI